MGFLFSDGCFSDGCLSGIRAGAGRLIEAPDVADAGIGDDIW